MSTLPLEIISNVAVAVLFFIFWVVAFIILYHLTRFGIGVQPKKFAAIFLFVSLALFCVALLLYANIDLSSLIT